MKTLHAVLNLFKDAFFGWSGDDAPRMGAALAYYSLFSLAPLLVIVIAIVALVFGQDAAEGQIVGQIKNTVGENAGSAIQGMLENTQKKSVGIIATLISIVVLLFGASAVLVELKAALNKIWGVVPPPEGGIKSIVKDRLFSLSMVLGIGFLLLILLVISAWLAALGKFLGDMLPVSLNLLQTLNNVISFCVVTVLFATIYKVLPDIKVAWKDALIGGAVTSLLFTIGKYLIGLYLGRSSVESAYGAAGSLVVLLVWIYYSAQILYFGAEFTKVYANRFGLRSAQGE